MFELFRTRKLENVLGAALPIRVSGIKFKIKKIDAIAFMEGSSAVYQIYQTYEDKRATKAAKTDDESKRDVERIRKHYSDVFMASVVEPKLCRKTEDKADGVIPVDNLFTDWTLVNELYSKIMEYSYGKKKV